MAASESSSTNEVNSQKTHAEDKNKCLEFLKKNWFMLSTILGVGVGFAIAFGVRATNPNEVTITWIKLPGDIYLRILTLTILPLIVSNIFLVIATLDLKKNGIISIVGITSIILANLIGTLIGTACAAIIQPGSRILIEGGDSNSQLEGSGLSASDVFRDIFMNLFPDNIIGAALFQYRTEVINETTGEKTVNSQTPGSNTIGILFIALVFGAAANAIGKVATPLIKFFEAVSAVVTKLMAIFLRFTPIGVCFMVAGSVISRKNIESDFIQLGLFTVTVLMGLAIYLILLILILLISSRKNPLRLLKYSLQPSLIAFAATTIAVAIGEMYKQLDRYRCNKLASRFVLPMCLALKGDGPAIFISAACMFITQQSGVEINASKIIFIILLTFALTCAIPHVPSASMVLVVTVLSSIGLSSASASILFTMEWFLDRCRSGTGAISAMYISVITSEIFERRRLKQEELVEELSDNEGADTSVFSNEV